MLSRGQLKKVLKIKKPAKYEFLNTSLFPDCYLRQGAHPAWQGAGGTEFARNGSRTCFLR